MPDTHLAHTLEDADPLANVGGEALPPIDTGRAPADQDRDPPAGLTPKLLAAAEATASGGDLDLLEEGAEQ